jgi:hypothetical protein
MVCFSGHVSDVDSGGIVMAGREYATVNMFWTLGNKLLIVLWHTE